jgi:uncharacterized NAD-dependent epimerase/dehydratase family protein
VNFSDIDQKSTPLTLLAEGCFHTSQAKTATGVIRYGDWIISSVIDSANQGKTVKEVTGIENTAPVVADIKAALALNPKPKALLIGIAPVGGALPQEWRPILAEAISNGLDIISGLHFFLNDDSELAELAKKHKVKLWDIRNPDIYSASAKQSVTTQKPRPENIKVITMVGSDCNIGKMCVALELDRLAKKQGLNSAFVATGQTGIMISGNGIPIDRIISDFAAGAMENAIEEVIKSSDVIARNVSDEAIQKQLIFIEGQGSLIHPGYSGVTLSLLHGSNPDSMILCHKPDRIKVYNQYNITIPSLTKLIEIYENATQWITNDGKSPAKVIGIALNTSAYSESEAQELISKAKAETKLPVTDPIRYGVEELLHAVNL